MKRHLSLLLIFSTALTQAAEGLLTVDACKKEIPSSIEKSNISDFEKIFNNAICSSAGNVVSPNELDRVTCNSLHECYNSTEVSEATGLADDDFVDQVILQQGADHLFFSQIAKDEFEKYSIAKSDNAQARDLVSFIETLPKEDQEKITKCPVIATEAQNICSSLEPTQQDYLKSAMKARFDDQLNKITTSHSYVKIPNDISATLLSISEIGYSGIIGEGFNPVYSKIKEIENNISTENKKELRTFEADSIVDDVFNEISAAVGKNPEIDSNQILKLIAGAIEKSANKNNDYVLSMFKDETSKQIADAIRKVGFSKKDFLKNNSDQKKILKSKINDIRINVANAEMSLSCQKTNLSIDNVCSNISEKMKAKLPLQFLSDNKNGFSDILAFLEKDNISSGENVKAMLSKFKSKPDSSVQKRFIFDLKRKTCVGKFGDNDIAYSAKHQAEELKRKVLLEQTLNALNRNREASRKVRLKEEEKEFRGMISRNPGLEKALKSKGISLDSLAKNENIPANKESIVKVVESKKQALTDNKIPNTINSTVPSTGISKASKIKNSIENRSDSGVMSAADNMELQARLASAEKKQLKRANSNALAAKTAALEAEAAARAKSTSEYSSLKKQIDELKKAQAKVAEDTTNGGNPVTSASKTKPTAKVENPEVVEVSKGLIVAPKSSVDVDTSRAEEAPVSDSGLASRISEGPINSQSAPTQLAGSNTAGSSVPEARKDSAEKAIAGIVLTSNGEIVQDPASIIENPKEADLVNIFKVTNGKPFVIRENGVLIKVSIELDSIGKPKIVDGKYIFKKEILPKKQQQAIANLDTNVLKSVKEIDRAPARLYILNSLIKEKVK